MSPVFDENKYRALQGKLEICEVKFLKARLENEDFRIDSSFYTKIIPQNKSLVYKKIGDCLNKSQYGISIEMNEDNCGVLTYRMNEIHNMLCDRDISKSAIISSNEIAKYALNDRDVLFNRTNSYELVGRTGIYYKNDNGTRVFASYLVRFVPNKDKLTPEYLTAFLSSKYGVAEIKRRSRESINQTNVNPEEVKRIEIPMLDGTVQANITGLFEKANSLIQESFCCYRVATKWLIQELGLIDWRPTNVTITTKVFAEVKNAGRLDAEYYEPKYKEIVAKLSQYSGGLIPCEGMIVDAMTKLAPSAEYSYVELADIGRNGEIISCTKDFSENLPSRARQKMKTNDVIVSSVEGSLSSCALVTEDYNNAICSTGFHVLRSSEINPETLLLLMKSSPIQALLKQGCSGTILTAILPDALKQIKLPLIRKEMQEQLAAEVQKSFALRRESKRLLELAKHAVEVAIEQGETAAMKLLEAISNA